MNLPGWCHFSILTCVARASVLGSCSFIPFRREVMVNLAILLLGKGKCSYSLPWIEVMFYPIRNYWKQKPAVLWSLNSPLIICLSRLLFSPSSQSCLVDLSGVENRTCVSEVIPLTFLSGRCRRRLQFYIQSYDCVPAQILPRIFPRQVNCVLPIRYMSRHYSSLTCFLDLIFIYFHAANTLFVLFYAEF